MPPAVPAVPDRQRRPVDQRAAARAHPAVPLRAGRRPADGHRLHRDLPDHRRPATTHLGVRRRRQRLGERGELRDGRRRRQQFPERQHRPESLQPIRRDVRRRKPGDLVAAQRRSGARLAAVGHHDRRPELPAERCAERLLHRRRRLHRYRRHHPGRRHDRHGGRRGRDVLRHRRRPLHPRRRIRRDSDLRARRGRAEHGHTPARRGRLHLHRLGSDARLPGVPRRRLPQRPLHHRQRSAHRHRGGRPHRSGADRHRRPDHRRRPRRVAGRQGIPAHGELRGRGHVRRRGRRNRHTPGRTGDQRRHDGQRRGSGATRRQPRLRRRHRTVDRRLGDCAVRRGR